jgi:hypothetical protein
LLQFEDHHLELYDFSHQKQILEIRERLPVTSLQTDRCISLENQFLCFGKEGARAYTKAMVEHVLSQDPISSIAIGRGAIYLASPQQEIVEHAHPFYHPKVFVPKTEIVEALGYLDNFICSIQAENTLDLYQNAIKTAKKSFDQNEATKPISVIDSLMNINVNASKHDPYFANKKLVI